MKQRMVLPDKRKIRNLKQYKDMTDEEFEESYASEILESIAVLEEQMEERVAKKLELLSEDYDMDDMKVNDRVQLRAMILAELQLEDLEKAVYTLRQNIDVQNIVVLEKLNNIMVKLRSDISSLSVDLQLTRRIRKASKEASVVTYLGDLKKKAMKFYKERMLYVFCPNCRYLLSTVWLLYPDSSNSLHLKCDHCNHSFEQPLKDLYKVGNKNLEDVTLP